MSKAGNWVPIDKGAIKTLGNIGRPYSVVEALFSHTVDVDCGKPWTINGYAKMWDWSRGKVRRFINSLRTQSGHIADRKGTQSGHPVHLIDGSLWGEADTKRTRSEHIADSKRDTTIDPNPNPKEKTFLSDSYEYRLSKLLLSKILLRNPNHKKPDLQKWAKEVDYMIRLDNRDPQQIANVINWAQDDSFEHPNILSTGKLRVRYDSLVLKMKPQTKTSAADNAREDKVKALLESAK